MAVNLLKKRTLTLAALLLLVGQAQATELLNSSYDVSRELFAALNPPFEQQWAKDNGGDKLTIKQSHAGSSKQALAILQGLKADVANLVMAALTSVSFSSETAPPSCVACLTQCFRGCVYASSPPAPAPKNH